MPICVPQVPKAHDALKRKAVVISHYTSTELKTTLIPINSNWYCKEFDFSFQSQHLCAGKRKIGGLGSPIAQYLSWKEPRFHQLIGLKIDEQDNEDLSGFFIRLNHPKVLSFILRALQ